MDIADNGHNPLRMRTEALCRAAGLSRSTIYQYLRSGILHPPIKEGPTQLRYDETHLKRIEKIRYLREQKKMSIPKIQEMFRVESPEKKDPSSEPNDLKNLLFKKSLELFSKNGLAKTKITDITDALNLGKGTFYLYFKSKEALFLECVERVPEIILPEHTWDDIRKERNFFQRQHKRLHYMLKSFPTFMGIISIAKLALRGDDAFMAQKATDCFQTISRALEKDIKRAIESGVIREVDPALFAFLTFGMAEALGYWLMINPNYSVETCIDQYLDFLSNGLLLKDADTSEVSNPEGFNGKVVDLNGTEIQLEDIRIDNKKHVEGKLGGGQLQIEIEKIGRIEVSVKESENIAIVTMNTGEMITVQIAASVTLSGRSPFGKYMIPITETTKIAMNRDT
ncbi:MAG: TetR family transcriptional regulator [Deltaproteobacteria bacterium]|nr:TetR family transcriptional regulator [Deltaproteobacteria bacterium]